MARVFCYLFIIFKIVIIRILLRRFTNSSYKLRIFSILINNTKDFAIELPVITKIKDKFKCFSLCKSKLMKLKIAGVTVHFIFIDFCHVVAIIITPSLIVHEKSVSVVIIEIKCPQNNICQRF